MVNIINELYVICTDSKVDKRDMQAKSAAYGTLCWSECEVLGVELGGHAAPDLSALHAREKAHRLQLEPVGLVKLRPDQEVEVGDLVVLAHKRGREPEFAVRLHVHRYQSYCT